MYINQCIEINLYLLIAEINFNNIYKLYWYALFVILNLLYFSCWMAQWNQIDEATGLTGTHSDLSALTKEHTQVFTLSMWDIQRKFRLVQRHHNDIMQCVHETVQFVILHIKSCGYTNSELLIHMADSYRLL